LIFSKGKPRGRGLPWEGAQSNFGRMTLNPSYATQPGDRTVALVNALAPWISPGAGARWLSAHYDQPR
jgi:hypothetical protein